MPTLINSELLVKPFERESALARNETHEVSLLKCPLCPWTWMGKLGGDERLAVPQAHEHFRKTGHHVVRSRVIEIFVDELPRGGRADA